MLSSEFAPVESAFLYNPVGKGLYCHAPTLLETSSGDRLAAWYVYPETEHVGATLAIARCPQNQHRWSPSETVIDNSRHSLGNPVLFQEPGGRIWLLFVTLRGNYWTDASLEGSYSEDGGYSWSPSVQLWKERGMMVRHPPVPLENGSMALPAYDEIRRESVLLVSRPPGLEWEELYRFSGLELSQPVLVRETSGRLTLLFRPWSEPRVIWRSHSRGDGKKWTVPLRTPLPNPLSGISAFTVGSSLAVVHNHTQKHQRFPLSVSVTRDGGASWEDPRHIETIEHEVSYPCFLNGNKGLVHGVYTYNRRMIKFVSFKGGKFLKTYGQNRGFQKPA